MVSAFSILSSLTPSVAVILSSYLWNKTFERWNESDCFLFMIECSSHLLMRWMTRWIISEAALEVSNSKLNSLQTEKGI